MATRDLKIYHDRWYALDQRIQKSIATYTGVPDEKLPRKTTILYLLNRLRAFAWGQFQFFYYGFEPNDVTLTPQDPRLQAWDEYPPEDVLTGILLQIGHDLDLIQRAAGQRMLADEDAQTTLKNADQLVWCALEPAIRHNIILEPKAVLTYFEKAAMFYVIPYANVAVIAVPFTATMKEIDKVVNPDYLAIPHEAGHYVFRHPTSDAKKALAKLPDVPGIPDDYRQWYQSVLEEMCADIYGCLVGGPVMAWDFESLALENSRLDFQGDDNQHPNPALRPLIYCQVLANPDVRRLTQDDWSGIAVLLAKHWNERLGQRHVEEIVVEQTRPSGLNRLTEPKLHNIANDLKPVVPRGAPNTNGPLGDVVKAVVEALITSLLAYLVRTGQESDPRDLTGWCKPGVDRTTKPEDLMARFDEWARDTLGNNLCYDDKPRPPEAIPGPNDGSITAHSSWVWIEWLKTTRRLSDPWPWTPDWPWPPKEDWPATQAIPSGEVKIPAKMQPGTWGAILFADGWTTEGPSGDQSGHPSGDQSGHPEN